MPERKLGEPVFGVLPIQVLVDTCCRSKVGFRRLLPITGQSAVGPKPAGLVEQYLPFNKAPSLGRSRRSKAALKADFCLGCIRTTPDGAESRQAALATSAG